MSTSQDLPLRTDIPAQDQTTLAEGASLAGKQEGVVAKSQHEDQHKDQDSTSKQEADQTTADSQNEPRYGPGSKYGFIIYRTGDIDDVDWARFMAYLNAQVHARMEDENETELIPHIDWNVQTSPDFENCGPETVREHFNAWTESGAEPDEYDARFMACVMVDEACIASVNATLEEGEPMDEYDHFGCSWVWLVSGSEKEGETRIGISFLMPRAYELLSACGWEEVSDSDGGVSLP